MVATQTTYDLAWFIGDFTFSGRLLIETPFDRQWFQRLAGIPAWQVAKLYGLDYDGDCDAVNYGGTFYNLAEWENYGYASCLELYPTEDVLLVNAGTVNKPDPDKLASALRYASVGLVTNTLEVVSAVKSYYGAEPDDHTPGRTYNLADWPHEWRLWKSLHPLLLALAGK